VLAPWTAASYAIGCANTAYYLLRRRTGADIRALGSGNAGARNAGRVLGWRGFLVVFGLDLARGALAAWGARGLGLGTPGAAAAMVAVVAGHVWPAQLGFRGGKGVAPALGAALVVDWRVAVASVAACAALSVLTRRFTLSGLVAVGSAPAWAVAVGAPRAAVGAFAAVAVVVLAAHRGNLREMLSASGGPPGDARARRGEERA
jgi:glycerol-3-phosphate acyltransferase PlsY